jgi:hypothetical protein
MGEGDGPSKGDKYEDGHDYRVSDRVEEQVHEVKEGIIYSRVEVNHVSDILEHKGDKIEPDARVNQVLDIISVLGIKRL